MSESDENLADKMLELSFARVRIKELDAEVERLREALQFYADGKHFENRLIDPPAGGAFVNSCLMDDGEVAKQTLEDKR